MAARLAASMRMVRALGSKVDSWSAGSRIILMNPFTRLLPDGSIKLRCFHPIATLPLNRYVRLITNLKYHIDSQREYYIKIVLSLYR